MAPLERTDMLRQVIETFRRANFSENTSRTWEMLFSEAHCVSIQSYYMSIEIYVKYWAEIKFVFHCILYFSHVKKVVSAL